MEFLDIDDTANNKMEVETTYFGFPQTCLVETTFNPHFEFTITDNPNAHRSPDIENRLRRFPQPDIGTHLRSLQYPEIIELVLDNKIVKFVGGSFYFP